MQERVANEQSVKESRDLLVTQAISEEKEYRPTLSQLVTLELIEGLKHKQTELQNRGVSSYDLENNFIFQLEWTGPPVLTC